MAPESDLSELAAPLVEQVGGESGFTLEAVGRGRNNRGFRVRAGERSFFLKSYFRHAGDPRERARTEWAFSRFAWNGGVRRIPQPLAADLDRDLVLFQWLEGERLEAGEVGSSHVDEALDFVRSLPGRAADGEGIPDASEARFSLRAHLETVDGRVQRLSGLAVEDDVSQRAARFVAEELVPSWERLRHAVGSEARGASIDMERELESRERCLSPSDFGFHNALRAPDGRLRFLDFEYAGWDDPAKLVCDFLCQPEVPVPVELHERFVEGVVTNSPHAALHRARIDLLRPVFRVKWTVMLLNEFLPTHRDRRNFANFQAKDRRLEQLAKAEGMLSTVQHTGSA